MAIDRNKPINRSALRKFEKPPEPRRVAATSGQKESSTIPAKISEPKFNHKDFLQSLEIDLAYFQKADRFESEGKFLAIIEKINGNKQYLQEEDLLKVLRSFYQKKQLSLNSEPILKANEKLISVIKDFIIRNNKIIGEEFLKVLFRFYAFINISSYTNIDEHLDDLREISNKHKLSEDFLNEAFTSLIKFPKKFITEMMNELGDSLEKIKHPNEKLIRFLSVCVNKLDGKIPAAITNYLKTIFTPEVNVSNLNILFGSRNSEDDSIKGLRKDFILRLDDTNELKKWFELIKTDPEFGAKLLAILRVELKDSSKENTIFKLTNLINQTIDQIQSNSRFNHKIRDE
ncbi:MAG: hypothetical protein LW817_05325, partial [Candidatus Caenarcaniphilales bacterium]|nr:hypothetical protein [Candidatus Caenarcaniphilales bacterium]